MALETGTGE